MATGRQRWANPHHSAKLRKRSIPEGVGTSSSFQEEQHSRFWCQGQAMVMVGHQTHQPPGRARYSTAHRMKQTGGAEKGVIAFAEP